MSAMKNLDLMIKQSSLNDREYEINKNLINQHFNGDLRSEQLPQRLKDVLFQWEIEEMELSQDIPEPWEDYDG